MDKPIVGITMGDPAGIGPEICVKALANPEIADICRPVVIGDLKTLQRSLKVLRTPGLFFNPIKMIEDAVFQNGQIDVLDLQNVDIEKLQTGKVSGMCGKAAVQYIEKAIDCAKSKKIKAIITGPINKEAIHKAGYKFQGHTEILAHHTKSINYAMMFVADKFWVILVTTHIPLKNVAKSIKKKRVLNAIKLAHQALVQSGRKKPKIAVAGLNPHAGEGGIFGKEEIKEIIPAIKEAQKQGIYVKGPISPDAVFNLASARVYDLVVAMYHDQGLIPLKLVSFNKSVNVTVGLPIIRTSVDHGTGFDIAGRGIANPSSLIEAIKVAASFSKSK